MWQIAVTTFLSFWRNRIIHIILFVSGIFIVGSVLLGQLALSESAKITIDFSLLIIEVFWLILVLFFWSTLLFYEQKQKTLSLLLLKCRRMSSVILWKFFGFSWVLLLYFLFLIVAYLFVSVRTHSMGPIVWWWSILSIVLIYIKLLAVLSIVLFFSSFVSPIVSFVSSLMIYVLAHLTWFLIYYMEHISQHNNIFQKIFIDWLYYILPNFEQLSIKEYLFWPLFDLFSVEEVLLMVGINFLYIFLLLFLSIRIYLMVSYRWKK